jgi:hypothetical protein
VKISCHPSRLLSHHQHHRTEYISVTNYKAEFFLESISLASKEILHFMWNLKFIAISHKPTIGSEPD